jgi:hypothetical protein
MRRVLVIATTLLVTSLVLGATVFRSQVASAAPAILNVFVTNDAANPVPVREQGTVKVNVDGTVNVSNFPSTQNVAGAVSSSDTTVTLASAFSVPITAAQQNLFTNLDVSAYKTIRIYLSCNGNSSNCPNTTINLGDFTDCLCILDSFALGGFNATRSYETISQRLLLFITNGTPDVTSISYKVVGRRN